MYLGIWIPCRIYQPVNHLLVSFGASRRLLQVFPSKRSPPPSSTTKDNPFWEANCWHCQPSSSHSCGFQDPSSSSIKEITPPSSTTKDNPVLCSWCSSGTLSKEKETQTEPESGPNQESEFTLQDIQETLKRKIEQTDVENLHILQEKYKILKVVQEIAGKELPSESSKEYTIRLSKISDIVHF